MDPESSPGGLNCSLFNIYDYMTLLKDESLASKLISKGFIVYVFSFIIAPSGYIVRVLGSNFMSVSDIGIFYSVWGLLTMLSVYNDLGLTEALRYYLPKYRIEKDYNNYTTIIVFTLLVQLITGIAIGGFLFYMSDWFAVSYFQSEGAASVLRILSIYFVLINIYQVFVGVFASFQDVFYEKLSETLRMYGSVFIAIFFWLTGSMTLFNFSVVWIGGTLISVIFVIGAFVYRYGYTMSMGKFDPNFWLIKKQLGYAFWIFLGANASTLLGQVDQQMIVAILGPESAGYYTNYMSLFGLYAIVGFPLMGLLFPITTELISKKQNDKVKKLLEIFYKYFSVFGLAVGGFMAVMGPTIALVLYGEKFVYSGVLMSYAAIFIVFNVLLSINFNIMAGMGRVQDRVKVLFGAVLVNVLGNVLFMLYFGWGLLGVIFATVIGWMMMFFMTMRLIRREYRFDFDWGFLLVNLIWVLVFSGLVWYLSGFFVWTAELFWIQRMFYLGILTVIYVVLMMVFNYRSVLLLLKEVKGFLGNKIPENLSGVDGDDVI